MNKLWEKTYKQNEVAQTYSFGDSVVADNELVVFDVIGSMAHAKMLEKINILSKKEALAIHLALQKVLILFPQGKFVIQPQDEDVHTKIENYLTDALGDIGKKIHTGRSRNDQVLLDLRLYTKEILFHMALLCLNVAHTFTMFAKAHEFVVMPGYTHMQKAMPSSVGMWAGSFAESLLDDLKLLQTAFVMNDQNPLGSGAAYGVSLPLDRAYVSALLSFAKTQNNSLYCQVSRGKSHLAAMSALTQIMVTLGRFAQDMLLFTTSEFNFFVITDTLCTGSSIMPQKKNVDVMEILRARVHSVISLEQSVSSIIAGLPSGYNADYGETKAPLMKAVNIVSSSLALVALMLDSVTPNIEAMAKACTPELYATYAAYELVKKGVPFRDAYKQIGLNLNQLGKCNPITVLKESSHLGGPGNLGLTNLKHKISKEKHWWDKKKAHFDHCIKLLKGGENI